MSKNQAPLWLQHKTAVEQKLLEQSKASPTQNDLNYRRKGWQ
ncbi:hypothetical protein [Acinetobacter bereziniae]|nr:hypothetical protein [Acinetobacter bereziniae]